MNQLLLPMLLLSLTHSLLSIFFRLVCNALKPAAVAICLWCLLCCCCCWRPAFVHSAAARVVSDRCSLFSGTKVKVTAGRGRGTKREDEEEEEGFHSTSLPPSLTRARVQVQAPVIEEPFHHNARLPPILRPFIHLSIPSHSVYTLSNKHS